MAASFPKLIKYMFPVPLKNTDLYRTIKKKLNRRLSENTNLQKKMGAGGAK